MDAQHQFTRGQWHIVLRTGAYDERVVGFGPYAENGSDTREVQKDDQAIMDKYYKRLFAAKTVEAFSRVALECLKALNRE